jgi:hypothetical protein
VTSVEERKKIDAEVQKRPKAIVGSASRMRLLDAIALT